MSALRLSRGAAGARTHSVANLPDSAGSADSCARLVLVDALGRGFVLPRGPLLAACPRAVFGPWLQHAQSSRRVPVRLTIKRSAAASRLLASPVVAGDSPPLPPASVGGECASTASSRRKLRLVCSSWPFQVPSSGSLPREPAVRSGLSALPYSSLRPKCELGGEAAGVRRCSNRQCPCSPAGHLALRLLPMKVVVARQNWNRRRAANRKRS